MIAPRVSVIVPTYNRADLIMETVESVLSQSLGDLELIVVDDGSDDGTPETLELHPDGRLTVVRERHSGIPGVARNAGLARARGEYVGFLDSDDLWMPHKLERQVAILQARPAVGLVGSNARMVDADGRDLGRLNHPDGLGATGLVFERLLNVNFITSSSVLARRSLVERVGGFREAPEYLGTEDYGLWLRLAAVSEVVYDAEPLVTYRQHEGSIRLAVAGSARWRIELNTIEDAERSLPPSDPRRTLTRRRRAELLLQVAASEWREGNRGGSRQSARRAFSLAPRAAASKLVWRPLVGHAWELRAAAGRARRRVRARLR